MFGVDLLCHKFQFQINISGPFVGGALKIIRCHGVLYGMIFQFGIGILCNWNERYYAISTNVKYDC